MLVSLVFLTCLVGASFQFGPVSILNIKKISECPGFVNKLKIQMIKDGNGRKAFNAQVDLKEEFNDKWTFKMGVNVKVGTTILKNANSYEGSLCYYLKMFCPEARELVYQKAGVESTCVVPVGNYNITDIYATEKVIRAKALSYGSFQLHYVLRNEKKHPFACYIFEVDHTAK